MNNLPAVSVSRQDVDEMKKLMKLMEGSNLPAEMSAQYESNYQQRPQQQYTNQRRAGHPAPPAAPASAYSGISGGEDVLAMKRILEGFYDALGQSESDELPQNSASTSQLLQENHQLPAPKQTSIWKVSKVILEQKQGRSVEIYQISNGVDKLPFKFVLKESAYSVSKLLNNGFETESAKVRRIIDMDTEFAESRRETAKLKQLYERSLALNETESADVFAKKHQTAKANALSVKSKIESIWEILE